MCHFDAGSKVGWITEKVWKRGKLHKWIRACEEPVSAQARDERRKKTLTREGEKMEFHKRNRDAVICLANRFRSVNGLKVKKLSRK